MKKMNWSKRYPVIGKITKCILKPVLSIVLTALVIQVVILRSEFPTEVSYGSVAYKDSAGPVWSWCSDTYYVCQDYQYRDYLVFKMAYGKRDTFLVAIGEPKWYIVGPDEVSKSGAKYVISIIDWMVNRSSLEVKKIDA